MFYQSHFAHCVIDALDAVRRENRQAESIKLSSSHDMGLNRPTMFKFEVTMPERKDIEWDDEGWDF